MGGCFSKRTSSTLRLLSAVLVTTSMVCGAFVMNSSQTEAAEERILRIGFMQKIDSLNPFVGFTDASYVLYGLVYDCLQAVDEDLGSTANLALGCGIDGDYEPYGSVWGFNLTENARWHDGMPLTADDVVFTVNLNADYYAQMWAYQPYTYFMDYAEKVNDRTVRIHFYDRTTAEPMPVAFGTSLFFPIMPRHMMEDMTPMEIGFNWAGVFEDSEPPLVGSGPFMATDDIYDEFLQGDRITLVRNPNYHWALDRGMDVRFDRIELCFFDDATAMAIALEMGDLDTAQFPPQEYLVVKDKVEDGLLPNIETYDGPKCTQYWTEIMINMNNAGPNPSRLDPVIRQAMAMATDKTYIVDNFYLGLADEGSTLISPVNAEWHYELTDEETYHFDLAEAEALLEAAGYRYTAESQNVRVCTADSYAVQENLVIEGTPLSYDMAIRHEYPEEKDIAMYLQSNWAKVGIEMEYILMTEPALGAYVYSYAYDTAIWCWWSDPDPNYILFCQSEYAWNGWNDNMYSTPEYEENYSASVRTFDIAKRKGFVDECQRIHYRDAGYIILAYPFQKYAWRTDTVEYWGNWAESPGMSIDAYWGGNPFYFEPISDDVYVPVTTAEADGTLGEGGWHTSDVTVTLDRQIVYLDTRPPVTTLVVDGTSGDNGWYVSEVTVSFEVADASGEVNSTWYSLDSASWEVYVEDIVIDSDGVYTMKYYSIDGSGNVETERTREIAIDRVDPSVMIPLEDGAEFTTSDVVIEFTCYDGLSGIYRCEYSLDGGSYEPCAKTEAYLTAVENGEHAIVVRAYDKAGNIGSDSLSFVVDAVVPSVNRTVDYVWKDMFAHPFGPWYEWRTDYYGDEVVLTDEYPYLYLCKYPPPGNDWVRSFMRLNVTGRDMTELSMNYNPEFLPLFSDTTRGGTAVLDWHMDYLTYEEAEEKLSVAPMPWFDGWLVGWNGTILLDEDASKAVLGISSAEFDGFDSWWLANGAQAAMEWESWLYYEAGPDRLDIYNMYEYDLTFIYFDLQAEKTNADHVLLTIDTVSWGMEALMTRWMNEAWMPTEWYMEDMDLHTTIGPHMADVNIDAAVAYSLSAYESVLDGTPCWSWKAMLGDYVESTPEYPISDFDPYADLTYVNHAPGNDWYGEEVQFDYTPCAWNLSEDETLTFEWPDGEQLFIVHSPGSMGGLVDDTTNLTANMTARYVMPMPFDDPDAVDIDLDQRRLTFTGPFDMWAWSQEQAAHHYLADEWERLGALPLGIPYIEFAADIEGSSFEMQISGLEDPILLDVPISFTVTVVNSTTQEAHADYDGTVTFASSDTGALLPTDYTFSPGTDAGSHVFVATFVTTAGYDDPHWLTVRDVGMPSLTCVADEIVVMASASVRSIDPASLVLAATSPYVSSTQYRVDAGDWLEYDSPLVIADEGTHTIDFYSIDSVGTVEELNTIAVKIDKTKPVLAFVTADGAEFSSGSVDIEWSCSDTVSGVSRTEYSIDGASYVLCSFDSHLSLINLSEGSHVLSVRVWDVSGWSSESWIQIEVTTEDGLLGPLSLLELAAIVAAIAAVALGAVFFLLKRKKLPPEERTGREGPGD